MIKMPGEIILLAVIFARKFIRNCGWTIGCIARYNLIVGIPHKQNKERIERKEVAVCLPMSSRPRGS